MWWWEEKDGLTSANNKGIRGVYQMNRIMSRNCSFVELNVIDIYFQNIIQEPLKVEFDTE